ncbi:acetolactate synthase large subunit [Mesorhizobium sp. VK25A]|uniref:Acetolactate synthase large subunit n=1 Tax=Mesorhizobium vachelliae TaxID=3072309 RepID=A0ABU5A7F2_9HYPH|nr:MULTISPECIES: acetolactate synthase large subunit [unclassified Mesorhizobium]MDX8533092.1 acetolactate synthase large subunit [Mesorhizobium sp. VK25D]MDX8545011.1 acetolactate synthase large subunit [Mesorhizobium sp. VK25A]
MIDNKQTGAEALVRTLIAGGVDTCFANPGTSEMHFVAALDRIAGIRCVLGLQENTVTGMADGYFRVTGRPAATLLHCGPGYANGIANIHNARRAGSGMLNIVGDHAISHVAFDSPLTSDVDALVGSTSQWHSFGTEAGRIGIDASRGLEAAGYAYGQVASLVLPANVSWSEGGVEATPAPPRPPLQPDRKSVKDVARALRSGRRVVMILGTPAVAADLHPLLAGIARDTGVSLMGSSTIAKIPRGRGRLALQGVPYPVDDAVATLAPYDIVVLVNCPPPTGFFLYPGRPSLLHRPDADVVVLSREDQDAAASLEALARELGVVATEIADPGMKEVARLSGPIHPEGFAAVVARQLPRDAIVVNEALTLGRGFGAVMPYAAPCDWLTVTGGAIGGGMPLATGAAIGARAMGCSNRRVITLQADGSAAYTVQALWTQAREGLPVTTLLLNNRSYAILLGEYAKVGARPGKTASDMMSLNRPAIDWCQIARGFGVESRAATTLEEVDLALSDALSLQGPMLIDVQFG